ncbi:hydrogenase maturation protease [Planotetraspora phitsanulokensis]|uniref:Peptidase M52 n=1 Tax=Planotetraspora phitsanulokensis TaxID=575192 RepID=A0A8J3XDI3_9ACTN|nr:peptidase M52 [Planotetraspora phitsanulokensis]
MVIGCGNASRGDDAAGLEVVRLLRGSLPPSVATEETSGDATELIDAWAGADLAIVIDAVCSGAAPGTVHRRIDLVSGDSFRGSSHSLGLAEAVGLGEALGRMPGTLIVFGIEGGDFSIGAPLSAPVWSAVQDVAGTLSADLR